MQGPGRKTPAYRRLSALLRSAIEEGRFGSGESLPTEAELSKEHGLSRHTVRQAFQDLVADGLVYRVPGRGTFVTGPSRRGRYLRLMGTLEEVMAWTGTEMEVLTPIELRKVPDAAEHLELESQEAAVLKVRRLYQGVPFVVTHVHLPPEIGKQLVDKGLPTNGPGTVVGTIELFTPSPVAEVSQEITAGQMPPNLAVTIDCQPGEAILHAERLYRDASGIPIEFAVSYYNARRYSYRLEMRRRTAP